MKKVLFCVVAMFLLCGCVAVSPVLDVSLTPQFAETFPKSNRQSAIYRPVSWKALKNWTRDDHSEALSAFAKSCESMRDDLRWKKVCAEARALNGDDTIGARIFFETHFQPYEMISDGEKAEGLITGYYLPLLKGSRTQTARYKYPIYKKPSDLVQINLRAFGIEHKSIRGRLLSDGKVVPYYDREAIDSNRSLLSGNEIFWVDDLVGLFFMHIQGSGLLETEKGEIYQLGYAAQNGHSYYAIGAYLAQSGEIEREDMSMQSIRKWLERHPDRMSEVMFMNKSYIFFEEGNVSLGVFGTQGVPLSAKRSIAVDQSFIPLGAPVFINVGDLNRLTIAQDTGGAIKGAVRADLFWGQGDEAAKRAGKMKTLGRLYILLPKERK